MGKNQVDIFVAGHLCLDLLPQMEHIRVDHLNAPGHLFETGPMHFSTGGAVSNTGLALHRLGIDVGLMSIVGDDLIGEMIIAFLNRRDPQLSQWIKVKTNQPSSYTVVLTPEKVDRIFLHCPGTNTSFSSSDIDYDLIARAKIFHLGYPPLLASLAANDGEDLARLFQHAKATGVITSLDLSLPDPGGASGAVNWRKLLTRTLPFVDIFVPSFAEAVFMLRRGDYDRWQGNLLQHATQDYLDSLVDELAQISSARVVGFKLSDAGIYLCGVGAAQAHQFRRLPVNWAEWGGKRTWHPAFQVEVVGTTGAGDAAYAGLLSALVHGLSIDEAARWACAVGACCVEAADATNGVLSWTATEARLERGWQIHQLGAPGSFLENLR